MAAVEGRKCGDLVGREVVVGFLEFVSGVRQNNLVGFLVILRFSEWDGDAFFELRSFWVPIFVFGLDGYKRSGFPSWTWYFFKAVRTRDVQIVWKLVSCVTVYCEFRDTAENV